MRRIASLVSALALVVVARAACAGEPLVIPGSGSSQTLLRELSAAFAKRAPGSVVEIPESIGTGGGMKAAGEGGARIARVGRRPGAREAAYGLEHLVFALQPVVFAAHPGVGVRAVTRSQSRDLFSGKITNWKGTGGPDLPVRVIARSPGETNLAAIQSLLPEWKEITFPADAVVAKTDQEMIARVAATPGAIGFNVISEVLEQGLAPLALGPDLPSDLTYPILIEAVFVFKPGALTGVVKEFVDFVFSPAGAEVIRANHAFPKPRAN